MARKMKDSGVEWIGEIPEEWNIASIKKYFKLFAGATPSSGNNGYWDGDIRWITPADYKTKDKYVEAGRRNISQEGFDSCSTYLIPKNSLIFSKRAPIGSVAINTETLCTNQGCIACVPQDNVNVEYMYYLMSILKEQFELFGSGTTFKEISAEAFGNFKLCFPTEEEQILVVQYLNTKTKAIDKAISELHRVIEDYKKYRKAIIIKATTKGLNQNVQMKSTDSEWIGDIPAHWDYVRIGALFQTVDERNDDPDAQLLSLYTALGVKPRSELEERGNKAVTVQNYKIVHKNDIIVNKLLAWMGAIGYSDYEGVTSPDYDVYRAKEGANVVRSFYNNYFRYTCFNGDCFKYGHGIMLMRWRTYPEEFLRIKIPNPPYDEQVEIAEYLDKKIPEIDKLISEKEELIKELESYKKSLIYEYVTGKKEVPVENVR